MNESRPWREFWVLMALAFAQVCLTGLFQTVVPYVYLAAASGSNPDVAAGLKQLQSLGDPGDPFSLTPEEVDSRSKVLAPLFEQVPWALLGFVASFVIYPFLGRLAGRYLVRPESSGLLILLSVATGQNPATVPLGLQYSGMGAIGLPLAMVILMVLCQFAALAGGIFSEPRVQKRL